MPFNFTNIEDTGRQLTSPGTIAVFTINAVEFKTSKDKNTPYAEVEFVEDGNKTGFKESFFLSDKALPRLQHVAINFTGQKFTGDLDEEQIKVKLTKKRGALKVGGRVGSNGKGYPMLAFGGFAKPEGHIGELDFTVAEKQAIDAALEAIKNSASANADSEGSGSGSNSGSGAPSGDEQF